MIKQVTIGYHALIREGKKHDVRVGFPGDGPYVDVVATPLVGHRVLTDQSKDEPGTYAMRGETTLGKLFLSLLMVAGG